MLEGNGILWKLIEDSFKKYGRSEKQLKLALYQQLDEVFQHLIADVNTLKNDVADRDDGLLDANIDQQSLLVSNAAMMHKLKKMGKYDNEHKLSEKHRAKLIKAKYSGENVRGGDVPNFL